MFNENEPVLHTAPSVGTITKKIMALYPDIGPHEIIARVRAALQAQGEKAGEFADVLVVNEDIALKNQSKK